MVGVGIFQRYTWTESIASAKVSMKELLYTVVQKNAPTLADYNCDPVQSILIIFSKRATLQLQRQLQTLCRERRDGRRSVADTLREIGRAHV